MSNIHLDRFFGMMIFIYVLMTVYFNETHPAYAHYFGLCVFSLAFIINVSIYNRKIAINTPLIFYLFFIIWAVVSFFWSIDQFLFYERFQRVIFCGLVAFLFYNVLMWHNIKNYFFWSIIAGGCLNIMIFFGIFSYEPTNPENWKRFAGTFGNANSLAIFLSFSIFVTILLINFFWNEKYKLTRWLLFLNIPAGLYLIVQTGSRKGLVLGIAFLFLFFVPFIKSVKGTFVSFAIVFMLFSWFSYLVEDEKFSEQIEFVSKRFEGAQQTITGQKTEESTKSRLMFIENGIEIWKENPFLGVGLNNFSYFFEGSYAHNNFVEILVNFGIVGFFFFYLFFVLTGFAVYRTRDFSLRISGLFFIFIFLVMDYVWVSYYDNIYLMVIVMLMTLNKTDGEKKVENSNSPQQ